MPPKRKGRERVQCMTCQAVINGDEQNSHKRRIHQNAAVKFRIYMEDSKQPKLSFGSSKSKEANDMDDDEIVSPAAGGDERVIEPSDIEDVDKVSQAAADDEERSNEPNDTEEAPHEIVSDLAEIVFDKEVKHSRMFASSIVWISMFSSLIICCFSTSR